MRGAIIGVGLVLGLAGAACRRPESEHRVLVSGASPHVETRLPALPARVLPAIVVVTGETRCRARRVYFDTDSAELTETARGELAAYARCLQDTAAREEAELRGRADPRGTESYNEELSRRRAEAVAAFLQGLGVQPDRLDVRALGETGDVVGTPQLWPQQRRVTVAPAR